MGLEHLETSVGQTKVLKATEPRAFWFHSLLLPQGESWTLRPPLLSCTFGFALGRPTEKMAEGSERVPWALGLKPSCCRLFAESGSEDMVWRKSGF